MTHTEPKRAATVVLLRPLAEAPCLGLRPERCEAFLLRRHGQTGFMPGATVFPGGKVDDADAHAHAVGRSAAECARLLRLDDPVAALAIFVAGIRELHEETHVLLARDASGQPATAAQAAALTAAIDAQRSGHRLAATDWHAALADLALVVDVGALVPFAHWLTPKAEPKRFDTWFFRAWLPAGQVAELDPHESTAADWSTPRAAVQAHDAGGPIVLPPPTYCTLHALAEGLDDPALDPADCGPRIEPWFELVGDAGPVIALPWDPQHPDAAAFVAAYPEAGPLRVDHFAVRDGRLRRVVGP